MTFELRSPRTLMDWIDYAFGRRPYPKATWHMIKVDAEDLLSRMSDGEATAS